MHGIASLTIQKTTVSKEEKRKRNDRKGENKRENGTKYLSQWKAGDDWRERDVVGNIHG